jgi:hypothetical protein
MIRLLLLVVIAYLVWLGIESLLNRLRGSVGATVRPLRPPGPPRDSGQGTGQGSGQITETLVRCAGCGAHFPRSRTLTAGRETFCSEECRRRAVQSA